MLYCYVQLWVCNWTSRWGNRDVLNRDWSLYLKTTSNFIENLCERKMQRGESKDEVYFWVSSGFLGTFFGKLKTSGISMTKSSRKTWSVQYLLVNILHSDAEEKKRRGNPQYKNGFIGNLYQPLKYLLLYPIFRVTSADATYSLDFEIGEERSDGQILFWKQFCCCLFGFVFWILLGVCLGQITSFLCAFIFTSVNWQQQ